MKIDILSIKKTAVAKKDLPKQFEEKIRPDVIKRAVEVIQSNNRQSYGSSPEAGKRSSALLSKRRRKYRGMYGIGISRTRRKIMSRKGTRLNWTGAFSPGTVGGRKAHPPKADKSWKKDINKKEKRLAIRSAIAATVVKEIVLARGHKVPSTYPFAVETKFEQIAKSKDMKQSLDTLGLKEELVRVAEKKIRAGKGKGRGRPYRKKAGILLVVSETCPAVKAAKNIPGVSIKTVSRLNAEDLAPGAVPGRLTIFTDSSIEKMAKDKLFI